MADSSTRVTFTYNEPEVVRVPKLNQVAGQAVNTSLDLDGGNAATVLASELDCDGGGV